MPPLHCADANELYALSNRHRALCESDTHYRAILSVQIRISHEGPQNWLSSKWCIERLGGAWLYGIICTLELPWLNIDFCFGGSAMAKNGFKILDSDMHIMEPPDLWERYIDGKFKHRAPRGVTSSNVRDLRMVYPDGREWARTTTRQNDSARGENFTKNQTLYRSDAARGWSPEVQLEAMDTEGIDVAVLYPTRGLRALVVEDMDAEFAAAIARAYNDWLYDFCKKDPRRLIGAGMISPYDMSDAVSEARRCAKELGFRAVFLRANLLVSYQWHDRYYEPLWNALEDLNLALGFHESTGTGKNHIGARMEPNLMLRRVYGQPLEQMLAPRKLLRRRCVSTPSELARCVSRSQL